MNRFYILLLLCFYGLSLTYAQNKTLTLNDIIPGGKNYRNFIPENLQWLNWTPESEDYYYIKDNTLQISNPNTGETTHKLTLDDFNAITNDSLTQFPYFEFISKNEILYQTTESIVTIDIFLKKVINNYIKPSNTENYDFNINSRNFAFTNSNNLFILTPNSEVIQLTNDADKGIVNGQTYHRNEFGIEKGTFWSPKGAFLAFARMDETMVSNYPLVDVNERIALLSPIKYPMAGMNSHEVTIGIYNVRNKEIILLKTGEPKDQYLTNLSWSPDEKTIYIAVLNRAQNHLKLNAYDVSTGSYKATLFEEKSNTWVEPLHPLYWLPNKPDRFIWQSNRDGHNHLYLYDISGKLIKQLTKGDWDVTNLLAIDTDGKNLFYTSTAKGPTERHTYKLAIEKGGENCLTIEHGTHNVQISGSGKFALDMWSNTTTPRKIDLIDINKNTRKNLLTAKNPFEEYNIGKLEQSSIKANDDSTDLYYSLICPPNFDSTKKYPVIVYVYGGPHAQLVNNEWTGAANLWQYYMAQLGYISFTIDNRGSANRGNDFEQIIHRRLGQIEMEDQMSGIGLLKKLTYVDTTRIGVHGWSYGGFMTTSLMTNFPKTFKVGVAGGPVIDWKYYEVMYGERYMDSPDENPEGYEKTSLLNQTNKLEGRLLMIHGAMDPVVVWQHSLLFTNKCITDGIQLDYFVYPNHEHNVRGKDRVHLMEKITRYFLDFL